MRGRHSRPCIRFDPILRVTNHVCLKHAANLCFIWSTAASEQIRAENMTLIINPKSKLYSIHKSYKSKQVPPEQQVKQLRGRLGSAFGFGRRQRPDWVGGRAAAAVSRWRHRLNARYLGHERPVLQHCRQLHRTTCTISSVFCRCQHCEVFQQFSLTKNMLPRKRCFSRHLCVTRRHRSTIAYSETQPKKDRESTWRMAHLMHGQGKIHPRIADV